LLGCIFCISEDISQSLHHKLPSGIDKFIEDRSKFIAQLHSRGRLCHGRRGAKCLFALHRKVIAGVGVGDIFDHFAEQVAQNPAAGKLPAPVFPQR